MKRLYKIIIAIMKRKLYLIVSLFVVIVTTAYSQIQHPTAWLRADSAVLNAPSWVDVSGNGLNATPSSGTLLAAFPHELQQVL